MISSIPRFSRLLFPLLAAFLMAGFGCATRQPEVIVIQAPATAPAQPCPPTPTCPEPVPPPPEVPEVLPMLPAAAESLPDFSADDLDMVSLKIAMDYSREYLNRFKPDRKFTFGPDSYTAADLLATLATFEGIAMSNLDPAAFNRAIREKFVIYRSTGSDGKGSMLFTGYYEPVMEGSLTRTGPYQYPIYRRPDDLVRLDLGIFSSKWKGDVIYGRVEGLGFVPYYDRKAIDGDGVLAGRGLEIAWVKDDIALFFFHIQGSGRVVLPDGREMRVQYDAENGRPFRSIGGLLIREGKLTRDSASMDGIRAYCDANPKDRNRVLFYNESYIFYRVADRGPLGLTEVPMTPGRSIATDRRLFPMGALCFIKGQKLPVVDPATGRVTGYRPFSRFVANQDTGGAIRTPGRLDLFFGSGLIPEKGAGSMKSEGEMFFLVLKSVGEK